MCTWRKYFVAAAVSAAVLFCCQSAGAADGRADQKYPKGVYCGGQALFDAANPKKFLDRLDVPYFKPEADFEKTGQYKDGTVFTEGLVFYSGKWHLYYGCADSFVGYAVWNPGAGK